MGDGSRTEISKPSKTKEGGTTHKPNKHEKPRRNGDGASRSAGHPGGMKSGDDTGDPRSQVESLPAGSPEHDEEIERLRRDLEQEKDRSLRLLADIDNIRRRAARDNEIARLAGQRAALLSTLPVLDALNRALEAGSTDRDFYKGVADTRGVFAAALREAGAEPIETIGRPFDPEVHEAVSTVPMDDVAPGTIVEEARPGWRLGGELLRPAQVVVASASDEGRGEPWR